MIIKPFSKTYDNFVLNIKETKLEKGFIYALLGANGSGKSTFSKCLSKIIDNDLNVKQDINVGYLAQNSYIFNLSVLKNISINSNDNKKINDILNKLELNELKNKQATSLSIGQKARVALARMLVKDYELLILDEPTASLDQKYTLLSEQTIKDYRNENNVIILISHNLAEAKRVADKFIFIDNGNIEVIDDINNIENINNDKLKTYLNYVR